MTLFYFEKLSYCLFVRSKKKTQQNKQSAILEQTGTIQVYEGLLLDNRLVIKTASKTILSSNLVVMLQEQHNHYR